MELDQNLDVRPAVLKFNASEQIEIKVNDHFFSKCGFFENFNSFQNETITIGSNTHFDGLALRTDATEAFIGSLGKAYNVKDYFDFFTKNSISNLYKIYTWYNFLAYPEMENIICAVILIKAYKLNFINPKLYAEFTECSTCVEKNKDACNFFPLNNYQKSHHNQLTKKIGDSIPQNIRNETVISQLNENICNILNFCNTVQYNKDELQDVLCECQQLKNQDEDEMVLNENNEQTFSAALKILVCQKLEKYNRVTILYLTNLTLDNTKYINVTKFLKAPNNKINTVIFNDVRFLNPYNANISFLSDLQDLQNNKTTVNMYLTGEKTVLTGNPQWSDIELSFTLLHSIYKKNRHFKDHFIESLTPATLFVDSTTIPKNLQKKLYCNSILYYMQPYFVYAQVKKLLTDPEVLFLSVYLGSVTDFVFSLCYNAFFTHAYGWNHFLVSILFYVFTAYNFFRTLDGTSTPHDAYPINTEEDRIQQEENKKKDAIVIRNFFIGIALITAFYIFKEVKYKPSGWHTYYFFPWTTAFFHMGFIYSCSEKNKYKYNYSEIRHGKVEFIKNIEAVLI
jgi:hypothetical protein